MPQNEAIKTCIPPIHPLEKVLSIQLILFILLGVSSISSLANYSNKKITLSSPPSRGLGVPLPSLLSPFQGDTGGFPSHLIDTPEYIILENKVPASTQKITISGLVVDERENPINGSTVLVRAGRQKEVKGGGQVGKNGRFSILLAKDSDPELPYFVEIHNLEYESASIPVKGTINSEIGVQVARISGSADPSDNELTPEKPFHERFFKNLITPYQKLKGVLRIN